MLQKVTPNPCAPCVLTPRCVVPALLAHSAGSVAAEGVRTVRCKPGDRLFAQGELTHSLHVVKTGLILLGHGPAGREEKPLALVGRGHVLGARALSRAPMLMWARAAFEATVCRVHLPAFSFDNDHPAVHGALSSLYARNMEALMEWTLVVREPKLRDRVWAALLLLARQQKGGARVALPRQADLAQLLCITRESLGRTLRALQAEGALTRIDRNRVDLALAPEQADTPVAPQDRVDHHPQ